LVPFDAKQHTQTPLVIALILYASIFDIAQQSEPYRNIGKMHVLYSFNFVELVSRTSKSDFLRSTRQQYYCILKITLQTEMYSYPLASRTVNRSSTSAVVNIGKFTVAMNASACFSQPALRNVLTMAECSQPVISQCIDESANITDASLINNDHQDITATSIE